MAEGDATARRNRRRDAAKRRARCKAASPNGWSGTNSLRWPPLSPDLTRFSHLNWSSSAPAGFCFNLIALLLLLHSFIPASRRYTAKFFSLSYRNEQMGYDDFYFVAFCILLLAGLRAGVIDHILSPLASRWGVAGKKNATRFAEQRWMLSYNVFWSIGTLAKCLKYREFTVMCDAFSGGFIDYQILARYVLYLDS